jgi:hypothetical protein
MKRVATLARCGVEPIIAAFAHDMSDAAFDMLIRVGFFSPAEALEAFGHLAVREVRQTRRRAPHLHTTSGCAYLVRSDRNEFTSQSRRHLLAEEF